MLHLTGIAHINQGEGWSSGGGANLTRVYMETPGAFQTLVRAERGVPQKGLNDRRNRAELASIRLGNT